MLNLLETLQNSLGYLQDVSAISRTVHLLSPRAFPY